MMHRKSFVFVCLAAFVATMTGQAFAFMCEPAEKTRININPQTEEVELDYSRSLVKIQETKTDTVDPYGIHSNSITQGFMEGQIAMKREVELDFSQSRNGRKVCLWYKNINIDVHITPKIVIAREVKRDRCMHAAVLEHEKKHVHVDRDVVNEAAKLIGKNLYAELSEKGFSVGPIPTQHAQRYADQMVQVVMDVTQKDYETMSERRAYLQANVDTLEEYERVSALCPDFFKHKNNLYKRALQEKKRRPDQQ